MVAAGVYLVARVFPLFTPEALLVIAYTGGITLFVAATVAVVMTDIKKVLAYSTVSQLGYMMLAAGRRRLDGRPVPHLLTARLLQGPALPLLQRRHLQLPSRAGNDQDGRAFPQDEGDGDHHADRRAVDHPGVPLLSGWYSKDAIIAQALGFAYVHPQHMLLFLLPLVTAGLTTFYMFRMWFLTFTGKPRDHHVYEARQRKSPWVMTVPLILLAVFSVCVAYGKEPWNPEESYLAERPVAESQPESVYADFGHLEERPGVEGRGGACRTTPKRVRHAGRRQPPAGRHPGGSAIVALRLRLRGDADIYGFRVLDPAESKEQFAGVHRFLTHKWYFDELYSALVVRPALVVAYWFRWFDLTVIDGIIHFTARTVVRVAKWDGRFDNGFIDGLVNVIGRTVYGVGAGLRRVQTGYLRSYVLFLVLAAVGVFLVLTWWVTMVLAG